MNDESRHAPSLMIGETASLFHLLGGMSAKHLIVVGGLVPPLLLPGSADTHIGSADVDFCLSVAITRGATKRYYESIQEKIEPFFEVITESGGFRWRKKNDAPGIPLVIDFLAPDPAETGDEPESPDAETATVNVGLQLQPFALRTGDLIERDAEERSIEDVRLVYRDALADVTVRFAGPIGFLAAKADALEGRDDTKDGYDISWWCLEAGGTASEVAELLLARPTCKDPLFLEAIWSLERAFKTAEHVGPDGFARELHPGDEADPDALAVDRNRAYARVSEVLGLLSAELLD